MITSIDTNILIALWDRGSSLSQQTSTALSEAANRGSLCVCGPVFAELLGFPGRHARGLQERFAAHGIDLDWDFGKSDWEAAGLAYQGYIARRQSSSGTLPRLMLTDFLIGAHAASRGYSLLTLDKRTYSAAFPTLQIESF